jgi:hypothetical protein
MRPSSASRQRVQATYRPRAEKARRQSEAGLSTEEHDCVLIVRDRGGATADWVTLDQRYWRKRSRTLDEERRAERGVERRLVAVSLGADLVGANWSRVAHFAGMG